MAHFLSVHGLMMIGIGFYHIITCKFRAVKITCIGCNYNGFFLLIVYGLEPDWIIMSLWFIFCALGMEEGQMYPIMFSLWKEVSTEWIADANEWHQKPCHPDS